MSSCLLLLLTEILDYLLQTEMQKAGTGLGLRAGELPAELQHGPGKVRPLPFQLCAPARPSKEVGEGG